MELEILLKKLKNNLFKAEDYLRQRKLSEQFQNILSLGFMDNELFFSLPEDVKDIYDLKGQGGSNKYNNRLMFPCYTYDNVFCGFIGRTINQNISAKYLLPSHILFSKETFIYNFNNVKEGNVLFVTENLIECGRVQQCGFQAVSLNGAYKSLFKTLILPLKFNKIVFIIDNDLAGKELKSYIKIILEEFTKTDFCFVQHQEKGFDEYFFKFGP